MLSNSRRPECGSARIACAAALVLASAWVCAAAAVGSGASRHGLARACCICACTPQRVLSLTREFPFIALEMNNHPTETPLHFARRLPHQPRGHSYEGHTRLSTAHKSQLHEAHMSSMGLIFVHCCCNCCRFTDSAPRLPPYASRCYARLHPRAVNCRKKKVRPRLADGWFMDHAMGASACVVRVCLPPCLG